MSTPTREDIAMCEADAAMREAARIERDAPKPRKGKPMKYVPTPLSAFTFRGGVSHGNDIVVERILRGIRTGHKLVYRRPASDAPYRFAFVS